MKKKCPYCGEEIMAIAKKCRFCGKWLEDTSSNDSDSQNELHQISSTPLNKSTVYYPTSLLYCLLIVGMMGSILQLLIYITPEFVFESLCDYSYEDFNTFDDISNIILVSIEFAFVLMMRNKIIKDKWEGKLPLWLLLYSICLGIILLLCLIDVFTFELKPVNDGEALITLMACVVLFLPGIIVGIFYLKNNLTSKLGWGTLAIIVASIIASCYEPSFTNPSTQKIVFKIIFIAIVYIPFYLFNNYRKFLQEK